MKVICYKLLEFYSIQKGKQSSISDLIGRPQFTILALSALEKKCLIFSEPEEIDIPDIPYPTSE
jgi:hypothetical protein